MAKKFRKIGVLTSGGDAPGMNAAARAVTCAALSSGVEVMGIHGGYRGLIYDDMVKLDGRAVSGVIRQGGTFLYTDRCDEFKTEEGMAKAVETCRRNGIDGIVAIGGDGTFRGATDLSSRGIPTIGIPGTIDNDVTSTDFSIGFDTAMSTVLDLYDKLHDTCESHARCNVVEVMGRNAGYIALETAIAAGAAGCAIAECPFDADAMIARMQAMRQAGQRSFLVVVAESRADLSEELTKKIDAAGIEARFCRPAHIVRGGVPTLRDRLLASRMGCLAVDELLAGRSDEVICERHGELTAMDIQYALIADRMYKGKLKDGDLDRFTAEQVDSMKALAAERRAYLADLYATFTRLVQ